MDGLGADCKLMDTTYMPFVKKDEDKPVDPRETFLRIFIVAGWQKREEIVVHPFLMHAAQYRANEMAQKGYFGHTSPSGITPNEVVRNIGYKLPDWYKQKGNNIESLYIGHNEPEEAINGWFSSPTHHDHLVGEGFYNAQNAVGIGSARAQDGRQIWVFISAPNMGVVSRL